MTWDRALEALMPQQVTITAVTGYSTDGMGVGAPSTSPKTVTARIEQKRQIVRDVGGREIASVTQVYVPPFDTAGTSSTLVVSPNDRIALPSGFLVAGSSAPRIINVERLQDQHGDYGSAIFL